jgi:hypothetical protein
MTTTAQLVLTALTALIVVKAVIAIGKFEVFCLRELARTPDINLRYLTREGWTAVIILMIPLGGMTYLAYGRAP